VPGWLEGREVLGGLTHPDDARPSFFVLLSFEGAQVVGIRDYRRSPYLGEAARFVPAVVPGA